MQKNLYEFFGGGGGGGGEASYLKTSSIALMFFVKFFCARETDIMLSEVEQYLCLVCFRKAQTAIIIILFSF